MLELCPEFVLSDFGTLGFLGLLDKSCLSDMRRLDASLECNADSDSNPSEVSNTSESDICVSTSTSTGVPDPRLV